MSERDTGGASSSVAWDALESLDAGVLLLSSDLHVTYANSRWTAWLGAAPEAGTPLSQLIEGDAASRLLTLRATLVDGTPRTIDLFLRSHRAAATGRQVV